MINYIQPIPFLDYLTSNNLLHFNQINSSGEEQQEQTLLLIQIIIHIYPNLQQLKYLLKTDNNNQM